MTEGPSQFKQPTYVSPETGVSANDGKVTENRAAILRFAEKIGKEIADRFPSIATDHMSLSVPELVKKYDIQNIFKIPNVKVAETAVRYALKRLIPQKVLNALAQQHIHESAVRRGAILYQTDKGIYSLNEKEHREASKKSAIARGGTPFSEEEENFMEKLDLNAEQYRTRRTKVNATNIAKELNTKFHNGESIINADAVSAFVRKMKKRNTPVN